MIKHAAELGALMLIVLALVKLFITTLCLATGWKGGYIFPTMFAGTALGMAAHLIFPGHPGSGGGGRHDGRRDGRHHEGAHLLGVVRHGAGADARPSPVIAIAVIVGALATARVSMMTAPQA